MGPLIYLLSLAEAAYESTTDLLIEIGFALVTYLDIIFGSFFSIFVFELLKITLAILVVGYVLHRREAAAAKEALERIDTRVPRWNKNDSNQNNIHIHNIHNNYNNNHIYNNDTNGLGNVPVSSEREWHTGYAHTDALTPQKRGFTNTFSNPRTPRSGLGRTPVSWGMMGPASPSIPALLQPLSTPTPIPEARRGEDGLLFKTTPRIHSPGAKIAGILNGANGHRYGNGGNNLNGLGVSVSNGYSSSKTKMNMNWRSLPLPTPPQTPTTQTTPTTTSTPMMRTGMCMPQEEMMRRAAKLWNAGLSAGSGYAASATTTPCLLGRWGGPNNTTTTNSSPQKYYSGIGKREGGWAYGYDMTLPLLKTTTTTEEREKKMMMSGIQKVIKKKEEEKEKKEGVLKGKGKEKGKEVMMVGEEKEKEKEDTKGKTRARVVDESSQTQTQTQAQMRAARWVVMQRRSAAAAAAPGTAAPGTAAAGVGVGVGVGVGAGNMVDEGVDVSADKGVGVSPKGVGGAGGPVSDDEGVDVVSPLRGALKRGRGGGGEGGGEKKKKVVWANELCDVKTFGNTPDNSGQMVFPGQSGQMDFPTEMDIDPRPLTHLQVEMDMDIDIDIDTDTGRLSGEMEIDLD